MDTLVLRVQQRWIVELVTAIGSQTRNQRPVKTTGNLITRYGQETREKRLFDQPHTPPPPPPPPNQALHPFHPPTSFLNYFYLPQSLFYFKAFSIPSQLISSFPNDTFSPFFRLYFSGSLNNSRFVWEHVQFPKVYCKSNTWHWEWAN